jgi:hypothetical protein
MVSAVMEAVLLYDMAPVARRLGRRTRGGRLRACVAWAAEPWVKKKERSLGGRGGHWADRSCHVPGGNKALSLDGSSVSVIRQRVRAISLPKYFNGSED